jgi:hypothetical protein
MPNTVLLQRAEALEHPRRQSWLISERELDDIRNTREYCIDLDRSLGDLVRIR